MLPKTVKETVERIETDSAPPNESKSAKQTEELLAFFDSEMPILFKDEMGEAHVQVKISGRKVIMACETNAFCKYLNHLYWLNTDDLISQENLGKVVKLIAAKAEYGDRQFYLHNRVALFEDFFWYDLGDSRAVKCESSTWSVVEDVPIVFRTFRHQNVQVDPVSIGGDVRRILDYARIRKGEQEVLFLIWLVCAFIPNIPHPILVLFGEKGASKSTIMRFTRSLIDPSKVGLMTLPKTDELVQQLAHHYGAFYDNVNYVSQPTSDILCRGVTGAGASKRRLYTDDEDVIYQFRRVIALNGINNVVEAPDLLDRSILVDLQRIPKEERKTESVLNDSFERDRPIILGGIFDTLVKAKTIFPSLEVQEFPRMADFAKWGCAVAEALGLGKDRFLESYYANIHQQNNEVIDNRKISPQLAAWVRMSA